MSDRSRSPRRSRSPPRRRSRSRSRSPRRGGGRGGSSKLLRGHASRWNERGFCFITPEDGEEDIFCHFSAITDGNCLAEGADVEYEKVWDDRKSKYRAENVTGGHTEDRRGGFGGGVGGGGGGDECYNWRDGRCTRGDSCRFSHRGPGGGGGGGGRDRRYDDRGRDRYHDRDRGRGNRGYDDRGRGEYGRGYGKRVQRRW